MEHGLPLLLEQLNKQGEDNMENEDIKYDAHATIVINESDTAYDDAKPRVMNAQEISAILRYDKRRQEELAELKRKVESVREYLIESYHAKARSAIS